MPNRLLVSVFAVAASAATVFAQAQPPQPKPPQAQPAQPGQPGQPAAGGENINQLLQRLYPDSQAQVTGQQEVNGVRVHNVTLTSPQGQRTAQVTDAGDVVLSSGAGRVENLPPPVAQLLKGLFQQPAQDVQSFNMTRYMVDIRVQNKPVRVVLDPLGNLVDIRTDEQITQEDNLKFPEASADQRGAIEPVAARHFPNAKVNRVLKFPEADNFFVAEVTLPQDRKGRIVMNGPNQVVATRVQLDHKQLPEHVVQSVNRVFNTDNIQNAFRYYGEYYRITQPATKEGQVVLQVTPLGEIMRLENSAAQATERAVTAGQRQAPAAPGGAAPAPTPAPRN